MKLVLNKVLVTLTCATIAVAALAVTPPAKFVMLRGYRVAQAINSPMGVRSMGLEIDSIMFRVDVTRVYGKLTGPHNTSMRIDKIVMTAAGKNTESNDIDGFDYTRAFQWEEDGVIPVEIDFAPMKERSTSSFVLSATTPKGIANWTVTKKK